MIKVNGQFLQMSKECWEFLLSVTFVGPGGESSRYAAGLADDFLL